MRKLFTIIALMLIILLPASAHAQGEVVFDTVDVSVWPEYDTPTILVIYKISLPAQSTLPVDITLKMPPGVGKISAIAVGNSPDTVSDSGVDSRFAPGTDSSQVSVKATGRFIQIEYYDPDLVKSANQHSYTYKWPGDYAVNNFRFEFRQPLQSSNVSVEPALLNAVMDAEGFSVSELKQANLKAGQKLTFTMKYQRDTDSPSTSFLKVEPSTPLDQAVTGQSSWTTYLPWGLGGLGLILLCIAGWIFWSSSKNNRQAGPTRRRHTNREVAAAADDGQEVHCSQCGKRAKPGDRFCRACGGRIRRSED